MQYKELKEMISFILTIFETFEKTFKDGKISIDDVRHFPALMMAAMPAIKDSWKICDEIKTIDKDGIEELVNFVKEDFDLEFDFIEGFIEDLIEWLADLLILYKDWKGGKDGK